MLTAAALYFGVIVLATGCGIYLTRVGTTTGHLLASAAGAFGCVLVAAAAAIMITMSTVMVSI